MSEVTIDDVPGERGGPDVPVTDEAMLAAALVPQGTRTDIGDR